MKPQFKVGEKVIIREDLAKDMPFSVNKVMEQLKGMEATIMDVSPNYITRLRYSTYSTFDSCRYSIDLDGSYWAWSNVMFTKVSPDVNIF